MVVREGAGADRRVDPARCWWATNQRSRPRTTCPSGSANPGRGARRATRPGRCMPPASHTIVTISFGGPVRRSSDRLGHGLSVDRLEPVEVQEFADRGGDAGERSQVARHAPPGGNEPGPVPEHRHVLDVVPRADVRQPRAHEVRLLRDVGELGASVQAPPAPRSQQVVMRDASRRGRPGPGRWTARGRAP